MANLRVNKITGTEVFETTGSVQFDGSGDVLTVPNTADFRLGSGDFTLECFMYYVGPLSSNRTLFGLFENSSARRSYQLEVRSTGVLRFEWWADGSTANAIDSPASTITSGQWSHIAVVRNGSVITVYLNGSSVATSVVGTSSFFDNTVDSFRIGALNAAVDQSFSGHISNVRVLKGTALYTKNFTPPTRELTVIPNTVLLCCTSLTRANEEKTGKTITVTGDAKASELSPGLLTDRIKSGGSSAISGSVGFAGTSYLSIADHPDFDFSNKSFTVEGWFNLDKGKHPQEVWFLGQLNSDGNPANGTLASITVRKFSPSEAGAGSQLAGDFYSTTSGSGSIQAKSGAGTTITEKTDWSHFAFVRDTDNIRMYVNGIGGTSVSIAGQSARSATGNFTIGRAGDYPNNTYNGFLSNIRVVIGTALYTQNFIPPTRELKKLPGTVLLCCQDSTNPLQEATGKTISLNGSVTSYSVGIGTTTPNPRNFTPSVGFDGTVIFDGVTKINSPNYFYLPTGTTEDRGRGRGLFGGGETPGPNTNVIEYIQIQTQGIAQDFGDLSETKRFAVACSSSTRGVFGGGSTPGASQKIEFITISTTGNAISFGNLIAPTLRGASCSSSTRGLFAGGYSPATPTRTNAIDYITIASTGSSQDFGDLTIARFGPGALASSTKGIFFGGQTTAPPTSPPGFTNVIDYVTIASTGNALTFGNIASSALREVCGCASATRGVYGSGYSPASPGATAVNVLEYITISSTGNGTDFGDLTTVKVEVYGSTSNSIRGVWAGGQTPSLVNTIDYVIISSTGNAQDFGDLTGVRCGVGACSDSHGGLG